MLEVFPRSIEGYGWSSCDSNISDIDKKTINKYEQQLVRYSNYIQELKDEIVNIKIENVKLKEELKILRDGILDNYEKTVDNHR